MEKDTPLVIIEWLDSRQPTSEWRFLSDTPEGDPVKCASVGWLLRDGDTKVICPNMGDIEHDNPQGSALIQIPSCCVTKISLLSES